MGMMLKENEIEKCLFVVNRKDLDRQTREEFNKFQEGCVEENTNTEILVRRMLSEDHADNQVEPEKKKAALMSIMADYNEQYGTNHGIDAFDLYYQDIQQRIKDQKYPNIDYPHKHKIDIVIVVEGVALDEKQIRDGYQTFKAEKTAKGLSEMAEKHGLAQRALQDFVGIIMDRLIFDGEQLSDLFVPLELDWKTRNKREDALMENLAPHLHKLAQGRESSGLAAYE